MGIRTSLPAPVPALPLVGLAAVARSLGNRLAAALRPVRVLDAVRWSDEVEAAFLAAGGNGLPPVCAATCYHRPLPFDPGTTRDTLIRLGHEIRNDLGTEHPAARLLLKVAHEGELTVRLVEARGTPAFPALSRELYGSTRAAGWIDDLVAILERLAAALPDDAPEPPRLSAADTARELQARFTRYFGPVAKVRVLLCDRIAADAAAGNGYLKLRAGAAFRPPDVRMLEVHEGWTHLGTTLNAQLQPVLPALTRCLPAATRTQEGLAVFLELVTGAAGRSRIHKLITRVRAVAMAEAGADFREVYRFVLGTTDDPVESYRQAARVFRGSLPTLGPFTKDLSYGEGLVRVLRFVQDELRSGGWGRVPLLLCGKTAIEDVGLLAELGRSGWLAPPRWVPPPLRDRPGLLARLDAMTASQPPA